jgi:chemotaxis protein CheZ
VQRKVFRVEKLFVANRAPTPTGGGEDRSAPDDGGEGAGDEMVQDLKRELALLHETVARNRHELSALIGEGNERPMTRAAGELGAAINGMETATEKILKSCELIDDSAKALVATLKSDYDRGQAQDIQEHVVNIYEACNFQDLAGQRIGKVVSILGNIEDQVAAMLGRSDCGRPVDGMEPSKASPAREFLHGPRLDGDDGHASQIDIDTMFA